MGNPALLFAKLNGDLSARDRSGAATLTGSGAVRYRPAQGARINLIRNPRFGNGSSFWGVGSGATLTPVNDSAFSYTTALDVSSAVNSGGLAVTGSTGVDNIASKVTHTVSFDVYLVSGATNWGITMIEADAVGTTLLNPGGSSFTPTSTVQRITYSYTPTSTGVHGVRPYLYRQSATASVIRVSNFVLETGTPSNPTYFDGSTGGAWVDSYTGILGTAHNSSSVSQAVPWIEEGTTNLVTNPQAASAATNWLGSVSGETLSRDTSYAYIGGASIKVVTNGLAANQGAMFAGQQVPAAVGQILTVSYWARGSGTVRIVAKERDAAGAAISSQNGANSLVLTDSWQRISTTFTMAQATAAYLYPTLSLTGTAATTFWLTSVQVEQKAYATSYCDGSLGTGYTWAGTAHASTSTRAGTSASIATANHLLPSVGSFVGWVYNDSRYSNVWVFGAGTSGAGNDILGCRLNGTFFQSATLGNGGSLLFGNIGTLTLDAFNFVYMEWNGTVVKGAVGNAALTTVARDAIAGNFAGNPLYLGSAYNGTAQINAPIGSVGTYDRPLTTGERLSLFSAGPAAGFFSLGNARSVSGLSLYT